MRAWALKGRLGSLPWQPWLSSTANSWPGEWPDVGVRLLAPARPCLREGDTCGPGGVLVPGARPGSRVGSSTSHPGRAATCPDAPLPKTLCPPSRAPRHTPPAQEAPVCLLRLRAPAGVLETAAQPWPAVPHCQLGQGPPPPIHRALEGLPKVCSDLVSLSLQDADVTPPPSLARLPFQHTVAIDDPLLCLFGLADLPHLRSLTLGVLWVGTHPPHPGAACALWALWTCWRDSWSAWGRARAAWPSPSHAGRHGARRKSLPRPGPPCAFSRCAAPPASGSSSHPGRGC